MSKEIKIGDIYLYLNGDPSHFKVLGERFGVYLGSSTSLNSTLIEFDSFILLDNKLWKLIKRNNQTLCEYCNE
jgi:hypothetical protein